MRVAMLVVLLVSAASARLASVPFKLNDKGLTGFIAEAYGSRIAVDLYGVLRITGDNRMYLVDDYSMSGDWWQVKYQRIEPLGQILSFTVRAPARSTAPRRGQRARYPAAGGRERRRLRMRREPVPWK